MRAVVQRVSDASVRVGGEVVADMNEGLLALVGVRHADREGDADELARKLVHLRVFEDERGRMGRSLLDTGGTLAVVSQFTLYADLGKGRRPSFEAAAPALQAEPLIERVVEQARSLGVSTVTGRFGERMDLRLSNAGPVTLLLDTEKRF